MSRCVYIPDVSEEAGTSIVGVTRVNAQVSPKRQYLSTEVHTVTSHKYRTEDSSMVAQRLAMKSANVCFTG